MSGLDSGWTIEGCGEEVVLGQSWSGGLEGVGAKVEAF